MAAVHLSEKEFTDFSAPVWGHDAVEKAGRPQIYGTATFFQVGPVRLVVTAAHVIDRLREAKSPPHLAQIDRIVEFGGTFAATRLPASNKREDDRLDLAFRLLTAKQSSGIIEFGRKFIPLDQAELAEAHDLGTWYTFCGWPTSRGTPLFRDHIAKAEDWKYQSVVESASRFVELGVSTSRNIVIGFDRENTACFEKGHIQAPDPHGISGGPIWTSGKSPSLPTIGAKVMLAGIGIEYLKKNNVLLGTRTFALCTMLWQAVPALRRHLPDLSRAPEIPLEPIEFQVE